MEVKELIKQLSMYNQDGEIKIGVVDIEEDFGRESRELNIYNIEKVEIEDGCIIIRGESYI